MDPRSSILFRDQRGVALISTFLVLVLMLTLGSAAMLHSVQDMRSTTSFNTGNQALYTAEAGLLRALNIINEPGVVDFEAEIVDRWDTLFTPDPQAMPENSQLTFSVQVLSDATMPRTRGIVIATGMAPANARRIIRIGVQRDGTAPGRGQGALYLAADSINSKFAGNAFSIDGRDHNPNGTLVTGGVERPGIATRNDDVTGAITGSLNDQQKDNIKGLGFSTSPLEPSVLTTGGPGISDLNEVISSILANNSVVTSSTTAINGNQTWGTVDSPQITHLTADNVVIRANGNTSGAGILIVDGSIVINGGLDFVGWMIVRGKTIINDGSQSSTDDGETMISGNATVLGSLWTADLLLKVGGSAITHYCSTCIDMADATAGGGVPKPVRVVSWEEVL